MRLFLYEFLSAGGLGADAPVSLLKEGAAMLAAALADFGRIPGVEVVSLVDQATPGSRGPHCRRTMPDQELDHFHQLARHADATLVIAPEFGGILEQRSKMVEKAGGRLLGCRSQAIRLAADKVALAGHWLAHAVPTPTIVKLFPACGGVDPRWDKPRGSPNDNALPVVLKPRFGAGSQATFLVHDLEELQNALQQAQAKMPSADFFLQQFVPGRAASVAFLIGPRQRLPLAPAWQHLSEDGRFTYLGGSVPLPSPWRERALRLGEQALEGIASLQGYVGVDLVLGADGVDYAIEINPRLTTSYLGLRELAKTNLAEAWLRLLEGEDVDPVCWRNEAVRFGAMR